jgi:hypothetical protein
VLELSAWCTLQNTCTLNWHHYLLATSSGSWVCLESYCVLTVVDFWCQRVNWKHGSYYKLFRIVGCLLCTTKDVFPWLVYWTDICHLWILFTLQKCCPCTFAGYRCFPLPVDKCQTSQSNRLCFFTYEVCLLLQPHDLFILDR